MKELKLQSEDIKKGNLILINSSHSILKDAKNDDLKEAFPGCHDILLEKRTADMLFLALDHIHSGDRIVPISGYRSDKEQCSLYSDSLMENGKEYTRKFVAVPGCSEHQTGLAIDLGKNEPDIDYICPDFPYNGICQAFREDAANFGFIERYPEGSERITNIAHEPWHFRFVGYPHSYLIMEKGLTLEEYTDYIKDFTYNRTHLKINSGGQCFEIFYVPVSPSRPAYVDIPDDSTYAVSGNNVDGVVVTLRMVR
jgi:D-alanyl-D-alanine dipeptidase/carboxypeptidase